MATPARFTQGISYDQTWQPLAQMGAPDPAFYHQFFDDFNEVDTNRYTSTLTSSGTLAVAAGDGGTALFTTNASTPLLTDIASVQCKAAGFALVQATSSVAGKKTFFKTRFKVSSATNIAFNVGLIQTTTTPFTVADGIYIGKATGSAANLTLYSVVGSSATSVALPTAAYTLADDTFIELAIYNDGKGNVSAFVNTGMTGYIPTSGTGTTTLNRGAVATLTPTSMTAVNLNPTLAFQSGTASSKTATVDFLFASRER